MRTRLWISAILAASLLATPIALAKDRAAKPPKAVEGETAEREVAELFSAVKWHTSVEEACRAAKASGRMVLWVHALGELSGDT